MATSRATEKIVNVRNTRTHLITLQVGAEVVDLKNNSLHFMPGQILGVSALVWRDAMSNAALAAHVKNGDLQVVR